jgi:uncharacterized cupin superfamily protein
MATAHTMQNHESELVRLLDLVNRQLKDIGEILKKDHEIILRMDDNLRRIKFNTQ